MFGYDIGCSFSSTVESSSLTSQFLQQYCHLCMNAFHGYAHNYVCQLKNHPNVIKGMGLEDLETMEWVFSSSNQLVSITCYASRYNRHVYIDLFFKNLDDDKYSNLANMIYHNYIQAFHIIETETAILAEAKASLEINNRDLEKWQEE
jgi:hypothetical protein